MSDPKRPSRTKQIGVLLGQNIASKRRARGLTQQELAERVGIESVTLSRLETGTSLPSITRLSAIADALDAGMAELVSGVSPYASDQAREIADCLKQVSAEDRYLLVDLVKRLAERLGRGK